ncbi:phosphotransferase [Candidatus Pacearchaeota archaeon]|nr:phosphotransferase [Candidatus Pacearchaeota archaeon]
MSYRVLIPTAGTGSRLGALTQYVNKSLVSIANRPTLSHVIEQFPEDVEFVIALGHKGHLVRDFLEIAYPDRRFFFVEVNPFEGQGSGLGLSMLFCKEYLQEPFVFISCDTLVLEQIPTLDQNWMGYTELSDQKQYRTLKIESGKVTTICEKGEGNVHTHKPYIGLAGIKNYQSFWKAMEEGGNEAIATGESHGMRTLLSQGVVRAHQFTWHDTGNPEALAKTREVYRKKDAPNILEKANEAIWFVKGQVIKFSDDENFITNRVKRARSLQYFVPEVTESKPHMYRYTKVEGKVLSEIVTLPLFDKLLKHSQMFWQPRVESLSGQHEFHKTCMNFYRVKTKERVELFYKTFGKVDGTETINGLKVPTLKELFDDLDWDWLAEGQAGRFHGDFHFENILYSEEDQRFTFLDWRQDFGGNLEVGDIYYDLAKLNHGLIISHELIAKNMFSVRWQGDEINYDFHRKQILVECERDFERWLKQNGYDDRKVRIITALIYLNIAALHHNPYCLLLYALGKKMLKQELE